jgi:hypothetical protein
MWRGEFISDLIRDLNFQKYLELGVARGSCWNEVISPEKVGVDLMNDSVWNIPEVISKSTDDYFESLDENKKFDIVFIDADHNKDSVKKDFFNSLKHLSENGVVVFHDVYPLSEENIQPQSCGTAYAFWVSLVDLVPENTFVYMGEPGHIEGTVGVYFNSNKKIDWSYFSEMNHTYQHFYENLDKYIISKNSEYNHIVDQHKNLWVV